MNTKLTIGFISTNFDKFNREYFKGELKTPRFEITHVRSYLGQYSRSILFNDSVIRISDMYDRDETGYKQTILHEMIHLYIRQNNIKDTRAHHGCVFNSIADRINRQGGWTIARTDSVDGCGLSNKAEVKTYYMACYKTKDGRYFRFSINPNYLNSYKRRFERNPNHFRDVFLFASNDDKAYAHYPRCHSGVRGYYIPKSEYDNCRETQNLIG
jgi:hypothetical protein